MMKNNYPVFILTNRRAKSVLTYNTLRKQNYTGEIYLVIDDEDPQADDYFEIYGDSVIQFCKKDYDWVDTRDNMPNRNAVVFARNAVFDVAEQLGYEYFIVLDDDYQTFEYRIDKNGNYKYSIVPDLDELFDMLYDWYINSTMQCLAIGQGGDYLGGFNNNFHTSLRRRKVMNFYVMSTKRRMVFSGRINEDLNASLDIQKEGKPCVTFAHAIVVQQPTQKRKGGLTETYILYGTYVKSFYSVMANPSCCKISYMGNDNKRIHHAVKWNNAVPMIISPDYKKEII